MIKTELEKFFDLDEDTQRVIIKMHRVRTEIGARHEYIKQQLQDDQLQLTNLQIECSHPMQTRVNRGDSGNWDRGQDSYWVECACPDCGKRWNEDQ